MKIVPSFTRCFKTMNSNSQNIFFCVEQNTEIHTGLEQLEGE